MAVQPQEAIKPLTVLELNTRIHDLLAARFQSVVVKGEVSGVSLRTGHVWFTLKDVGKVMVFDAHPPFSVLKSIDTGPITNHVNFAHNANGTFAYVTVGGLNESY